MKICTSNSCKKTLALLMASGLLLSACGQKKTELGEGSSEVTGSAGPAGAKGASKSLVKCDAPVATLALVENPNGYAMQTQYNLPASPVPLIRLLAQQSGCFRVVDRSAGLKAVIREQELQDQGILRKNTTVHKGQGYEAQYTMTPSLTFSENKAGGD
ncbi:MAG: curli production assembly/transport component CsgG, partial [Burkholderiales bacterium]|nr:curli production assembly/transport component CsgG [Burkholderiales bacterium]